MRRPRIACLTSILLAPALSFACGGSSDNTGTPSGGDDAGDASSSGDDANVSVDASDANHTYPSRLPIDPPQVTNQGGPVMAAPKIIPIFFANDDATTTAAVADFVKKVGKTQYWIANTAEYGVGAATGADPVQLTSADNPGTTIDDTQIQTWLAGKLNANDAVFGTPDANTLYALFYPPNVTITLGGGAGGDAGGGGGAASCSSFGGYHSNIQLDAAHGTMNVAYAVMPRCASFGPLMGLDVVTGTASHEFVEAVTDPFPQTMPAYAQVDVAHIYWQSVLGGSETGDMCAQFSSSFTKFPEMPAYTVQRCWSNKGAVAGHDPCAPALAGEVYFNTAPVLDMVQTSIFGQLVNIKGVKIPVSQSKTVALDLFSDGPTSGPWTVSALDGATLRGQAAQLKFSFDKTTGVDGDTIQMTIQVLSAGRRNREAFIVESSLNGAKHIWIGEVVN
jgi:hypothetical protein